MSFSLSESIDATAVRRSLAENRYAHVASILPAEHAQRLHSTLLSDTPWNLVFNDNDKHFDMPAEQLRQMSKQDLARLQQAIFAQARDGFQYCYHNYPIFDAVQAGQNDGHLLHRFYDWLNGEEFLAFARAATGFDDINFVDAQATRYSPGHFLARHDDTSEGKHRRAAYILNLTPEWRCDWGGFLQLLDDDGNIRAGLAPTFNALNIITIPQPHNVSFVTPFAGAYRFAITGWLRHEPAGRNG